VTQAESIRAGATRASRVVPQAGAVVQNGSVTRLGQPDRSHGCTNTSIILGQVTGAGSNAVPHAISTAF
jgi:hypothetical protein